MNVTAASLPQVETTPIRNATLAELEARIAGAVTGADSPAGETILSRNTDPRERRRGISAARRAADACGKCARALADDEPVWHQSLYAGNNMFDGNPIFWQAPVCEPCAGPLVCDPSRWEAPAPCIGCGRKVTPEKGRDQEPGGQSGCLKKAHGASRCKPGWRGTRMVRAAGLHDTGVPVRAKYGYTRAGGSGAARTDVVRRRAGIRAGYSPRSADVDGPRLLGNVGIAEDGPGASFDIDT